MPATSAPIAALDDHTIVSLTPDTWPLFEGLVTRANSLFGGCWCTWFHPDCAGRDETPNRELKKRWVDDGTAHAALVVVEGEAIAWAEYGTPGELPRIHHRKEYDATREAASETLPDYRITCIFVDKRFRRRGVTALALQGALDLIAAGGGGVVEGYPHEPGEKRMSASFLYNGTRTLYERAGFTYVRPKGMKNCVMRRTVERA